MDLGRHNLDQAAPKVHPPARALASMAYDAASRTVMLFGGITPSDQVLADTWTWGDHF